MKEPRSHPEARSKAEASSSTPARAVTAASTAVAMIAFAANSVLCRLALRGGAADPATFSTLRLASGAALLAVLVAIARSDRRAVAGRAGRAGGGNWVDAFLLALYAIAFSFAYVRLDVGTAALILFGTVQVTMLLWALRSGERPPPLEWAGLACALAGLVLLVAPGLTTPPLGSSAVMAVAGLAWGRYSLRGRGAVDPLADNAGNFLRAVPMAIAVSLIAASRAPVQASSQGIWLAVASGAIASGLGYAVWYKALRGLAAARAAVVQLSVPVIAAAGGRIFLGERVSTRLVVAAAMILGGIGMALVARRPAGKAPIPASRPPGPSPTLVTPASAGKETTRSVFAYLWASPATLVALALFLPLAWLGGGQARWVSGVLEIHGGGVKFFLSKLIPIRGGATALTLGHVVAGRDAEGIARTRAHERVHVRQYELFGPFMVPAYLALSAYIWLRGRHYYFDHPLEVAARHGARLAEDKDGG
jgi:drug/metabolite transporter (DMT)-like permease